MLAKGGIDHTWFLTNGDLGAPFDQQLFDFPVSLDNLNLVGLKVLGTVTGSVGATVNIFYVLTFVAVAVSMLLVLRALGVSRGVAAVDRVALHLPAVPLHARGAAPLPLVVLGRAPRRPTWCCASCRRARRSPTERERRRGPGGGSASGTARACSGCSRASPSRRRAPTTPRSPLLFLAVLAVVDFSPGAAARARVRPRSRSPRSAWWRLQPRAHLRVLAIHGQDTAVVRRNPSETEFEGLKISQLRAAGRAPPHPGARRPPGEEHEVHADPERARPAARHHRRARVRRPARRAPRRHPPRPARAAAAAVDDEPRAGAGAAAGAKRC